MGAGPVPGHSGKVAQLRLEVAPREVVVHAAMLLPTAASHGSMRVASCKAKLDLEQEWLLSFCVLQTPLVALGGRFRVRHEAGLDTKKAWS